MKKKLLIFHPIIAPYRIDMVNELVAHFDVTLCLFASNLQGQKFNIEKLYEERLFIKPKFLTKKVKERKLVLLPAIWREIGSCQPDVIIVSEFSLIVWGVLLYRLWHGLHYKVISLVDDSIDMIEHVHSVFIKHSIARTFTMPLLDEIINLDIRAAEWYQRKYGKGVFFPLVSNDVTFRERLQRILPISEEYVRKYLLGGKKILLFVGRLSSEKNISMAIEAFLQVQRPDCQFVIVGAGPEEDGLHQKYGNEKTVMFAGRYEGDALYAWYNVAQVLILPSVREPFGAVTNEALMSGCWVLLSEVAGSGCLIEENRNGSFVSPHDKDNMSAQIAKALGSAEPIELPLKVKSDRMIKSFQEYIDNLIRAI